MSVAVVMVISQGYPTIEPETPFGSTMVCENRSFSTNLTVLEALKETVRITIPTSCPRDKFEACLFMVICFGLGPTSHGVQTT